MTLDDVVAWAQCRPELPPQVRLDEAFGQPPLTVARGDGFWIDVLFWYSGNVGIHQHQFAGAFTHLHGSSVHARYRFQATRSVGTRLQIGRVSLAGLELLPGGAVRTIRARSGLIHSLFHLVRPSVTVVVRTPSSDTGGPEFEYKPPGVAIDPSRPDTSALKRWQLLSMLLKARPQAYERMARIALSRSDEHATFVLLEQACLSARAQVYRRLVERAGERFPGLVDDFFRPALEESWRRAIISSRRTSIVDPEQRFLLALLLHLPDRRSILKAVRAAHPGREPLQLLESWARGLASSGRIGVDFDEPLFGLFRRLLRRKPPAGHAATPGRPSPGRETATAIDEASRRMRESPFLGPLLR